jgi:hypothetical protein
MAERRAVRRYELAFPITVRVPGFGSASSVVGTTIDISPKGVYFILKRAIDAGTAIDVTITPPQLLGAACIRGGGRVLRIDRCHENSFRIAASLESCEISRDNTVDDVKPPVDAL